MEKQTLGELTAQKIIVMIQELNYRPGDKLPTEVELSGLLHVGRNTVREALRILMSRNIVNVKQGAGTFLSEKNGVPDDPLGFAMMGDRRRLTKDLLQVRAMLEPQIAAMAAQNASAEDLARLEKILLETEELILRRKDYSDLDSRFHVQIAVCSHNTVISNLIPVITDGVQVFASEVMQTEYEQTLLSHRSIFDAIKARKPVEAGQAMSFHLLYNENRYNRQFS